LDILPDKVNKGLPQLRLVIKLDKAGKEYMRLRLVLKPDKPVNLPALLRLDTRLAL